ncbi:selenocysteine-specific translation elongation factor [Lentzea flaviverrucosa]|uniref:Selenocysteine-specific elongation factor n=1 Tax=Lentzea flaviverrucosa TaxID=200379 RepID=A0A1H9HIQ1_9PSEU|nr:selenocysteine-specific translation elongation factor [Lentzea flaviverrucosa]RDI34577.1 selenocysteine-specific elongation factor [Lentzea flaviverrucosa]SEQ62158.1 selenocysteine-specific elongation factor [Lentzea flaviverrucosa]
MPVIVTAGHVDHGKSALVRALTGREPDRWEQERARGMSIGLGFVWTRLPSGAEVSFVDVPGHRRLVATMLAGAAPAPAVLFAVAADEGWSAQSAEHLAALDALGTGRGVLVVTKSDRADPRPAAAEAQRALAGTSLSGIPVFAVSAVTGAGLPELRAGLDAVVAGQDEAADDSADVRLWVDRSFTVTGAGTVVTATLASGSLRLDDRLRCARTGLLLRVRGLQVCERPVAVARPVRRVAVNLAGGRVDVRRGDALLAPPEAWRPVDEFDVLWCGDPPRPQALTVHFGTAAVSVRVRALGPGVARLRTACAVPVRPGDRLLLRDPGGAGPPVGAVVVDVRPAELTRRGAGPRRGAELLALAGEQVDLPGMAVDLLRRSGFLREEDFRVAGLPVTGQPVAGGRHADPSTWESLAGRVPDEVAGWCAERPLARGMPLPVLADRLSVPSAEITRELVRAAGLSAEDGVVVGRAALPDAVEKGLAAITESLRQNPFRAPEAHDLARAGLGAAELASAVRAGRLLQLAPGVVVLPGADRPAAEVLRGIGDPFTVSQARQAWDTTRRTAVPLLELLDREGVTRRRPDGARELS